MERTGLMEITMHPPTILFATDFSDWSQLALQYAASQARALGARLLIVHVDEVSTATGEGMLHSGIPGEDPEELERRLRTIDPEGFDGPCEYLLLEGDPAAEIVRTAEEENAEMIVLGTHGRTGLARLLMGSVAEQVVRRASCPVLVVKDPALAQK